MKKFIIAATAAVLAVVLVVSIFFIAPSYKQSKRRKALDIVPYTHNSGDRIYFLRTGSSDAIILQSGEHFAMIDAGEDNDNPRGFEGLELKGYEKEVLEFLKSTAGDDFGRVHLDFVLATHAHSDHIGGFDTIINDESVSIDRAYVKRYDSSFINPKEIEEWDNQEVYDQMIDALNSKNVPIISDISDEPFSFGNFTLTILNTEYEDGSRIVGENDNSLAVLAQIGTVKTLLTGDLDNYNGDEIKVAEKVGKVDILKVGHHSYSHSTSNEFLELVKPELAVVTNNSSNADNNTIRRIMRKTSAAVIFSDDENGLCIEFTDNGYTISKNIM